MGSKVVKMTTRMLEEILSDLQFAGIWTVYSVKRNRASSARFRAQCVIHNQHTRSHCIKCYTMPETSDKDTGYEVLIEPPHYQDAYDAFEILKSGKRPTAKPSNDPKPLQPSNDNVIVAPNIKGLPTGHPFVGTVVNIERYGAFIRLTDQITGMIHTSEWTYKRPPRDMHDVTQIGDRIRVAIIGAHDGKIALSKRAVEDMDFEDEPEVVLAKFSGIPDENGELRMAGFADDIPRAKWLLEVLAKEWANGSKNDAMTSKQITEHWTDALRKRYDAQSVSKLAPIYSQMSKTLGWLEVVYDGGRGQRGYSITGDGWNELGGREKYGVEVRVKRLLTTPKPPAEEPEEKPEEAVLSPGQAVVPRYPNTTPVPTKPAASSNGHIDYQLLEQARDKLSRIAEIENILKDHKPLMDELAELKQWVAERPEIAAQKAAAEAQAAKLKDLGFLS